MTSPTLDLHATPRAPLWIFGAALVVLCGIIGLHKYNVSQQALGAARERLRGDSIALVAVVSERDTAIVQLERANVRVTGALQTVRTLRASVNVAPDTPDTQTVPVSAGFVKACDLIVISCDSLQRASKVEKAASDSLIRTLTRQNADLRVDLMVARAAAASPKRSIFSGVIGGLAGYGVCSALHR